ncbi:MAG: hypothetical protein A2V67_12620 [Deltaproteobacteria bacterium RBG_13_61_14]|nr:MAG: hypothetical protein A2V67_12620 [Deltaproteobacteria bacterium RBG_13_61_14]
MSADKYTDPKLNPFIPAEPGDHTDPAEDRAPFTVPAAVVARRIAERHPDKNELALAGHALVKMADGSYKVNGTPMAELSPSMLLELLNALR